MQEILAATITILILIAMKMMTLSSLSSSLLLLVSLLLPLLQSLPFVVQATNGVGSGMSKVVKITVRGKNFLPHELLPELNTRGKNLFQDEDDLLAEGIKHVLLREQMREMVSLSFQSFVCFFLMLFVTSDDRIPF